MNNDEINEAYGKACSLAKEYSDSGKFDLAIKEYKKALEYIPTQIQAMGELCYCLGQIDRPEEMLEWAKKALVIAQKRCSKDNIGRFYFYIAQYYKITDQFEKAIDYFNLSIINKPYFLSNYIDKAYCCRMIGDYEKALNLYNYVKKTDEDYANELGIDDLISKTTTDRDYNNREMIHMKLGVELEKKGDRQKANESYFTAVQRNPKHVLSLFLLFKNSIALKKDNYEIISIGENLMLLLNSEDKGYETTFYLEMVSMSLAKYYEVIGNREKSAYYSELNKYYHHYNEGQQAEEEGEQNKALEAYKKALEIKNDSFKAIDALIDLYFKTREFDEAMDYAANGLTLAREANNGDLIAKYTFDMGCRLELSHYDKAVEFYEEALKSAVSFKSQLKYCHKLADYYAYRGDNQKALHYYKKCIDYINAGEKDLYDIPSSIIKQEELLDKNSNLNRSFEHYNIGAKYYNEMNFEAAAKEMQISLDLIPQDLDTMDVLNRCLYKLKRFDECYNVAYAGYMVSLRDHDYRFMDMFCYNVANILYNSKEYDKALRYYQLASIYVPNDTDYLYFIGACYRNLGRYNDAVEYFKKVLEINPNDQGASEQLNICMSNLDN